MAKTRTLVDNVADAQQAKNAERVRRERQRQRMDDLRAVLDTPEGRRVLWGLLEECHVMHTIYAADPHDMYRKAGEHNVGLRWLADMERARPGIYAALRLEFVPPAQDDHDAPDSDSRSTSDE